MSKRLPVKCPFCRILMKFEFSRQIFESLKHQVSSKSVHADRHMTKLTVAFRNFANAPKNDVVDTFKKLKTLDTDLN
jgi:hypothetical protein